MARPNPDDRDAFADRHLPALRAATFELSWLLERGYAEQAALTVVGDKHQLTTRQRMAVRRSACPEPRAAQRRARRIDDPRDHRIAVDGFNQLVTTERGLAGGAVLRGRDGALRDVASVHGTWRRSARTEEALDRLVAALDGAAEVLWILDAAVSNSGRLAGMIRARGHPEVLLEGDADAALLATGAVLAPSDSVLLDRCAGWLGLSERVLLPLGIEPIELSTSSTASTTGGPACPIA